MIKLAIPVLILCWIFSPANGRDEVGYPRKSTSRSLSGYFYVPTEYPTIQSAIDAAQAGIVEEMVIVVEEGEYRESLIVQGLKNLKLTGRNARIIPPEGIHMPPAAVRLENCVNFSVEGFTFIGDNFTENSRQRSPMGCAIHIHNSSGRIFNNLIFNYFEGINFEVDNHRWMKGAICHNYIHNCLWSGILATGTHNLTIQGNRIAFTIPKTGSLAVGIWADGGIGRITDNRITSYRTVDPAPYPGGKSLPVLLPPHFDFTGQMDYQVFDNTFEQSAACAYLHNLQAIEEIPPAFVGRNLAIRNYFINVKQSNPNILGSEMVMVGTHQAP
jgi:hypothetical protein